MIYDSRALLNMSGSVQTLRTTKTTHFSPFWVVAINNRLFLFLHDERHQHNTKQGSINALYQCTCTIVKLTIKKKTKKNLASPTTSSQLATNTKWWLGSTWSGFHLKRQRRRETLRGGEVLAPSFQKISAKPLAHRHTTPECFICERCSCRASL